MGRTRDDLDGHEGYVLAELERAVPIYAEDRWTATGCADTDAAGPTGRHRAACECGWRGQITETGERDVFLSEGLEDALLAGWEAHTDQLASLAELRISARRVAREQERIGVLVLAARNAGRSWSEIADALGVTKQAAQQRYG